MNWKKYKEKKKRNKERNPGLIVVSKLKLVI